MQVRPGQVGPFVAHLTPPRPEIPSSSVDETNTYCMFLSRICPSRYVHPINHQELLPKGPKRPLSKELSELLYNGSEPPCVAGRSRSSRPALPSFLPVHANGEAPGPPHRPEGSIRPASTTTPVPKDHRSPLLGSGICGRANVGSSKKNKKRCGGAQTGGLLLLCSVFRNPGDFSEVRAGSRLCRRGCPVIGSGPRGRVSLKTALVRITGSTQGL